MSAENTPYGERPACMAPDPDCPAHEGNYCTNIAGHDGAHLSAAGHWWTEELHQQVGKPVTVLDPEWSSVEERLIMLAILDLQKRVIALEAQVRQLEAGR